MKISNHCSDIDESDVMCKGICCSCTSLVSTEGRIQCLRLTFNLARDTITPGRHAAPASGGGSV